MTTYRYYTATPLDGFLADEHDGLDWLLDQPQEEDPLLDYDRFIEGVGALVMGRSTYAWIMENLDVAGGGWPYAQPSFVLTHAELAPVADSVRFRSGPPAQLRAELEEAAGEKEVWIVGGGDLAQQFAAAGMLDLVDVSVAPVLLGSGKPLFTAAYDLELLEAGRNAGFLEARYRLGAPRERRG